MHGFLRAVPTRHLSRTSPVLCDRRCKPVARCRETTLHPTNIAHANTGTTKEGGGDGKPTGALATPAFPRGFLHFCRPLVQCAGRPDLSSLAVGTHNLEVHHSRLCRSSTTHTYRFLTFLPRIDVCVCVVRSNTRVPYSLRDRITNSLDELALLDSFAADTVCRRWVSGAAEPSHCAAGVSLSSPDAWLRSRCVCSG